LPSAPDELRDGLPVLGSAIAVLPPVHSEWPRTLAFVLVLVLVALRMVVVPLLAMWLLLLLVVLAL